MILLCCRITSNQSGTKPWQVYTDHAQKMYFSDISIEHILPQNPKANSQWLTDSTDTGIDLYVHDIGNLVLIGRQKNSSLSNADFTKKMKRYYQSSLQTIPHTLKVLNGKTAWTWQEIHSNQENSLKELEMHYLDNNPSI